MAKSNYIKTINSDIQYKEEYCTQLIDFFSGPQFYIEEIKHYRNGKLSWIDKKQYPNSLPFIEDFAASIGVTMDVIERWCMESPNFKKSCLRAREIQKAWLINNSLKNLYNAQFSQFTAKNLTDMKDVSHIEEERNINVSMYLPENSRNAIKQAKNSKRKGNKDVQEAVIIPSKTGT